MGLKAQSQTKESKTNFSLKEAVAYALQNNANIKNASLDQQIAEAKIKEVRAMGLPQISGGLQIAHSPKPQKTVLEVDPSSPFFGGSAGQPGGPAIGSAVGLAFQLKNSGFANATLNQLIFDGSYLVALQATQTYRELSQKATISSKIDVVASVTKAYYGVLVNEERIKLFDANIQRLDSTLRTTRALFNNGFVEKIDLDRLEVTLNNLKVEKQNTNRLVELSRYLLKFQMSMDIDAPITLTDKLDKINITDLKANDEKVDYNNRIEFDLLNTQQKSAQLELRNIYAGYLPKLYGSATYGANTSASKFENLTDISGRWFKYDQFGLSLQIPIFDSFMKLHQAQQKKITIVKLDNTKELLKRSIDLESRSAHANLDNSIDKMQTQRANMTLAQEVVRVTKLKYEKGIGNNLEITSAEASLKEAQVNYYNALYDALVAKVDLQKATGKLQPE